MGKHLQVTGTPAAGNVVTYSGGAAQWLAPAGGGGTGTVTSVTSADANATVATTTTTPVITIISAPKLATARTIAGVAFDGSANISLASTNLSDVATLATLTGTQTLTNKSISGGQITSAVANAVVAVSFSGSLVGDVSGTQGATVVAKINGVSLAALATGLLKNTTTTGAPSIATPGTDYQAPISLTTAGTSGAATFSGGVLNVPQYAGSGGSGTVTSISVATANGFSGTVATPTSTPVITIATAITGLLKGNGTSLSAAVAGTDYLAPNGSGAALTGITESQITNLTTDLAAKQATLSLTTTGSGAATLVGATLNIPTPAGGGTGITRSINSVSGATTAGATALTDYVYFVTATTTITLPTAVSNTNSYVINNDGAGTVTVATTGGQTINGSATVTIAPNNTLEFISNNANWKVI